MGSGGRAGSYAEERGSSTVGVRAVKHAMPLNFAHEPIVHAYGLLTIWLHAFECGRGRRHKRLCERGGKRRIFDHRHFNDLSGCWKRADFPTGRQR